MLKYFKEIKKWFGYEKVVVLKAKKDGPLYDVNIPVKVSMEYRKFYVVNMKSVFWNIKNYVKYKLKMNYMKDRSGDVAFRYIYQPKAYHRQKDDFAIIPRRLITLSSEVPRTTRFKSVGTIDRNTQTKV